MYTEFEYERILFKPASPNPVGLRSPQDPQQRVQTVVETHPPPLAQRAQHAAGLWTHPDPVTRI